MKTTSKVVFLSLFFFLTVLASSFFGYALNAWYGLRILVGLSFSFLTLLLYMFILAWERKSSHIISRVLYKIFSVIIGALYALLLAMIPSLLLYWIVGSNVQLLFPLFGIFFLAISLFGAAHFSVKKISLRIKNLEEPVRLVQISDLHLGAVRSKQFLERIIKKTNAHKPDVLLVTGDIFDGTGNCDHTTVEPFKKSTAPVVAVLGNHDLDFGAKKAQSYLEKNSVKVLRSEVVTKKGVQLAGLDCRKMPTQGGNEPLIRELKTKKDQPLVLLYHVPSGIQDAKAIGTDLFLAGHTHAGQLFPFSLLVRLLYKHVYGLFTINTMQLYVSSGIGAWGPPLRFLTRAEIVVFDLKK